MNIRASISAFSSAETLSVTGEGMKERAVVFNAEAITLHPLSSNELVLSLPCKLFNSEVCSQHCVLTTVFLQTCPTHTFMCYRLGTSVL